jgi:hypothetical protein
MQNNNDKIFAKKLVKLYCLGRHRYIKKRNIIKDLLKKFEEYRNNKYGEYREFEFDIISILAIIKLEQLQCDSYCIERYLEESTKLCSELEQYIKIDTK